MAFAAAWPCPEVVKPGPAAALDGPRYCQMSPQHCRNPPRSCLNPPRRCLDPPRHRQNPASAAAGPWLSPALGMGATELGAVSGNLRCRCPAAAPASSVTGPGLAGARNGRHRAGRCARQRQPPVPLSGVRSSGSAYSGHRKSALRLHSGARWMLRLVPGRAAAVRDGRRHRRLRNLPPKLFQERFANNICCRSAHE